MRKLLFVLMAALAFVACQKEEDNTPKYFLPKMTPQTISCVANSETELEVISDIPAAFFGASYIIYSENGEKIGGTDGIESNIDPNMFSIVQVDKSKFKVVIKPTTKRIRVGLAFIAADNPEPGRGAFVIVAINPF